jgi:hypothetical protein
MLNNGTINEGLHTVDTNADGVANGYTLDGGASTLTVVAPTTADNLVGNWQQIALPSLATNYARLMRIFSTGWSVGDIVSFSARVQTDNIITTAAPFYVTAVQANASYVTPGGVSDPTPRNGWVAWTVDVDGMVYVEFPILTGTTGLSVQILISNPVSAGIPRLRVGEVTLRNLTTGGLLI